MKISTINIVCSLVIHFQPILNNNWITDIAAREVQLLLGVAGGLALLAYPICGWIAEVYNCQGKMIKWSFLVNMTSAILIVISITIAIILPFSHTRELIVSIVSCVAVIVGLTGLGMYEANAIQFGMDQMMDASSEQLSSFIHWYFWSVHFGNFFAFYITIGEFAYMTDCKVHQLGETLIIHSKNFFFNDYALIIAISLSIIQILAVIIGYIVTSWSRLHHIENQQSRNSLKIIFQVLKYSYHHKYPERRSAFTYWENDIPSRIDLGKEKYGGPFTYEQVEDVKTFFRLLLLILSLFGFHILGNGYSLSYYIMNTVGCPTLVPIIMIVANPEHIPTVIIVIGVPLFQYIQKYFPRFMPNMLNRLWLGLVLSLITEATQVLYTLLLVPKDFDCSDYAGYFKGNVILKKCLVANIKIMTNNTCNYLCNDPPVSTNLLTVYLSVIPFTLLGISYLLIFMTILEFICAQSPNALKGLLIGIWYSTTSINFPLIHLLDTDSSTSETIPWNIYHGIKGIGIFLSIISFSLVYRYYRYRERNEIVNEQNIIEEQYERELLMNQSEDTDSSSDEDDELIQNYTKNE